MLSRVEINERIDTLNKVLREGGATYAWKHDTEGFTIEAWITNGGVLLVQKWKSRWGPSSAPYDGSFDVYYPSRQHELEATWEELRKFVEGK